MLGRDFNETYSPSAQLPIIHLLLVDALIHGWHMNQLAFVQAFPQAPISHKQFVEIPRGIDIEDIDPKAWLLEVLKNVYGGKDARCEWYLYLCKILEEVGIAKSKINDCLFYNGKVMFVLHTDDSIMAGPDEAEIETIIAQMKETGLQLTVDGTLADFLGVNIQQIGEVSHLTKPS